MPDPAPIVISPHLMYSLKKIENGIHANPMLRRTHTPIPQQLIVIGLLALCLIPVLAIMMAVFRAFPPLEGTGLALDWRQIYPDLKDAQLNYQIGLRNPPWGALVFLPLGLLPLRDGWAALTLLTIIVLIVSVPRNFGRRGLFLPAVLLLITAHPTMRHFMDGNFEAIIIAGTLLVIHGYNTRRPLIMALGILGVSAKPQEAFLLILIVGLWLLQTWPLRRWLLSAGIVLLVVAVTMLWRGQAFIGSIVRMPEKGLLVDMSLGATLGRFAVPDWLSALLIIALALFTLALCLRPAAKLGRERAALLIAGSMLCAPYTAGNSFLTVVAIGLIPLFLASPRLGLAVILLTNLQYLFPNEITFNYSATFGTCLLLLSWIIFAVRARRESSAIPK